MEGGSGSVQVGRPHKPLLLLRNLARRRRRRRAARSLRPSSSSSRRSMPPSSIARDGADRPTRATAAAVLAHGESEALQEKRKSRAMTESTAAAAMCGSLCGGQALVAWAETECEARRPQRAARARAASSCDERARSAVAKPRSSAPPHWRRSKAAITRESPLRTTRALGAARSCATASQRRRRICCADFENARSATARSRWMTPPPAVAHAKGTAFSQDRPLERHRSRESQSLNTLTLAPQRSSPYAPVVGAIMRRRMGIAVFCVCSSNLRSQSRIFCACAAA